MRRTVAVALLTLSWAAACARSSLPPSGADCSPARAVSEIALPGNPFQALATADGCYAFVSLVGPVEPGDPRRPPRPGAPKGGVAVVRIAGGEPALLGVTQLEGSPYGMVLTHDGRLLIVASDDRVAFLDPLRLIAGSPDAVLSYLRDAPDAGRVYANVTPDDRWLFLSDESARAISVVDLARARASSFDAEAVVGQIPVGRAPIALTFSPDHRLLYTTSQVAPESYGWPPVCRAPGSDTLRQRSTYAKGAILVVDVARATRHPASSVVGAVSAGCNPVRLAISPTGAIAYVPARTDNALLAFDTRKILADSGNALIARVPVGQAPVGVAVLDKGATIAVTSSNRFATGDAASSLTIIDAAKVRSGAGAVVGTVPAGVFPRELALTRDRRTLLLTNFGSKTLTVIDVARLPVQRAGPADEQR